MTIVANYVASLAVVIFLGAASACAGAGDEGSDPDAGRETTGVSSPDEGSTSTKGSQTTTSGQTGDPTSVTTETDGSDTDEEAGPGFIQNVLNTLPNTNPCSRHLPSDTAFVLEIDRLEKVTLCFADQGWRSPINLPRIQLTLPDGSHASVGATAIGHGTWLWQVSPGVGTGPVSSTGTYGFSIAAPAATHPPPPSLVAPAGPSAPASSGSTSTASTHTTPYVGTITVVSSRVPRLVFSSSAHPGGTVFVALAGYVPSSTVQVVAYGPGVSDGRFTRSYPKFEALPGAVVGPDGEARISWTVPEDTQPGSYGLWVDPLGDGCTLLCLGPVVS